MMHHILDSHLLFRNDFRASAFPIKQDCYPARDPLNKADSPPQRMSSAYRLSVISCQIILVLLLSVAARAQSPVDGMTPSGIAAGTPTGSYSLSNLDNVNLFNGNLSFQLPLVQVDGRGGAKATISLAMNSAHWVTRRESRERGGFNYNPTDITGLVPNPSNKYPPRYSPARMVNSRVIHGLFQTGQQITTLTRIVLINADGTEQELRDQLTGGRPMKTTYGGPFGPPGPSRGTVFVAADGSGITYVSDQEIKDYNGGWGGLPMGTLMFPNGTRYRFWNGDLEWIKDRNGNTLTFSYAVDGQGNRILGKVIEIRDSLNRTVTITYSDFTINDPPTVPYDQLTFTGFGQNPRTVKVWYSRLGQALRSGYSLGTYKSLFPALTPQGIVGTYNPWVVQAVELPDTRRYQFYYNPYKELARIELPTGGALEYEYTPSGQDVTTTKQIHRRVIERRAYLNASDTSPISKQIHSASVTQVDATHFRTTSVVEYRDPVNLINSEKHFFYGSPSKAIENSFPYSYTPWNEGHEYQVDVLNASGVTVKSEAMTWQQRAPVSWWPLPPDIYYPPIDEPANDPRIVETITTLPESNLVSKKTSIDPQTGALGFDQFNNRTDVWEYDYGAGAAGLFLRRTHTDYLSSTSYTDVTGGHLRNLPTQQWVSSDLGGANKASLIAYAYDQFGTVDCPSVTGHDPAFSTGYTIRGNLTSVTRYTSAATGTGALTASSTYDISGNVVSGTDPKGHTTQFSYADSFSDSVPRNSYAFRTSTTSPVPDPTGQFSSSSALITSSVYDFSTGLVTSSTDPNNKTTTYEYIDALDRLTKVNLPDGGRTTYIYVDAHQCGSYVETRTLLDATGRELDSFQFFDKLGRPTRTFTYENQDTANPFLTLDTQYDAMGRIRRVSNPYRSSGCTSEVNPSNRWTETTFDALGRTTQVRSTTDNSIVTTSYSGNEVTVTEQSGRRRRSVIDALGRLVRVDEPDDSGNLDVNGSPAQPTYYVYDALDNLHKVQQGAQQRFYLFDSMSRLIRAKTPEQAVNSAISNLTDSLTGNSQWSLAYGYDADGNLTSRIDARNVATTYDHDNLDRNTTVRYSDGITKDIDRHYDGAINGRGRFYYFNWDSNNNTRFDTHLAIDEYDAMGRVKKHRQHFLTNGQASEQFLVIRTYDLAGNVTSQTYPSGRTVNYLYDIAGRLSSFTGNIGDGVLRNYSTGVSYDEFGGIRQEQFGTQIPLYRKLHYNGRGQLFDIRLSTVAWASDQWNWNRGAIVNYYSANYAWEGNPNTPAGPDNNGNLLRQQHWAPTDDSMSNYNYTQETYSYDYLNRLKSATEIHGSPSGQSGQDFAQMFVYDRYGNRTIDPQSVGAPEPQFELSPPTNQEVPEPSNRLYAPGDANRVASQKLMRYNAAGSLIYDGYTGSGTRAYDAENRMISAQDTFGGTTSYTYDADGRRVKRNIDGTVTRQLYGIGGELLAEYAPNDGSTSPQKEYGYRNGQLLVTAEAGSATVFSDDFNDNSLDSTKWSIVAPNSPAVVSETGQRLQIALPPNTATYNGVSSNATFDITGKSVQVELAQPISQAGWCEDFLQVALDANNYYLIDAGAGSMVLRSMVGGVNDQTIIPTFDPVAHRYWRIRHNQSTNTINFDTSPDGSGWTTRKTVTASFSLTSMRFYLYAGAWGTGNSNPGAAKYDNFQLLGNSGGTGKVNWLVTDHLGTARMIVDQTGTLAGVKRHDYLPFGEELYAGTGGRTPALGYAANDGVRQKFTGKERDSETNLDYFGARYYSSPQGRFTSVDPSNGSVRTQNPQSLNRYSYCLNNPLRLVDRDGQIPVEEVIDVITLAYDFYELIKHPSWTNAGFFAWDIAGTLIPYVPGSWAGRGLKWATRAEEVKGGLNISREAVEWSAQVGRFGYKGLRAQGVVGKLDNALEIAANNTYIRSGIALLAQGDKATRRLLALERMAADFVGVAKNGWYIIGEAKGIDTWKGVEQLRATAQALGDNPNVPRGATLVPELIVEDISKISPGYQVVGNELFRWDDRKLVPVTVTFQGREVQVQVRILSLERNLDR